MTHEEFLRALARSGLRLSKEETDILLIYAIRQSETYLKVEYSFLCSLINDVLRERTGGSRAELAAEQSEPLAEDPLAKRKTMMTTGYALGMGGGGDSSLVSEGNQYNKPEEESPRQSESQHSVGGRTERESEKEEALRPITPLSEREPAEKQEESTELPREKAPSEASFRKSPLQEEEKKASQEVSKVEAPDEHSVDEGRRGEKRKRGILDTYTTNRLLQAIKQKIFKKIQENITAFLRGEHFDSEPEEETPEGKESEELTRNESFFFRLAKYMHARGLTLQSLMQGRIYDDVSNLKQIQIVRMKDFFEALDDIGFESSSLEKGTAIGLLKHASLPDLFVLSELELILASCGLRNSLPQTKNFDYTRLDPRSKRIMNRLNAHLKAKGLSVEEFVAPILEQVEVQASNSKSETLSVMNAGRFNELLCRNGIRHSEEDYDNLNMFLCLNENSYLDVLMLRKLKVAILDFSRSDYLQSFGVKKRRFYYDEEPSN